MGLDDGPPSGMWSRLRSPTTELGEARRIVLAFAQQLRPGTAMRCPVCGSPTVITIAAATLDELDRRECGTCQWSIYVDNSVQTRRTGPVDGIAPMPDVHTFDSAQPQ